MEILEPRDNQMGALTITLLFAALVSGIGSGFQHGYNIGVVNAPQVIVEKWIKEVYEDRGKEGVDEAFVSTIFSFVVSAYSLGGILGGIMTSTFAIYLGRRGGLMANNFFAILAGLLMYLSKDLKSPEVLILGRFITGYNCGLNSGLCSMYLVEISPKSIRGAMGSIYQLIITISILVSQLLGLESSLGTPETWHILYGLILVVGILQFLLLFLCPESPKYLFTAKSEEKSKQALEWLRWSSDVGGEVAEIKAEADAESKLGKTTLGQMCSQPVLRAPLIISCCIMLAQQLSGINVAVYYSTKTFVKAGFTEQAAQNATLGMGAMNILMTIVSVVLVDLAGRKTLILVSLSSMFVVTCGLAVSLTCIDQASVFEILSVILLILFVVCFAIGTGSIPWFMVSEFFTPDARPLAASIAVSVNWLANFAVSLVFLPLLNLVGPLSFILFAVLQFIFIIYIALVVPETKNKTYEEISASFK